MFNKAVPDTDGGSGGGDTVLTETSAVSVKSGGAGSLGKSPPPPPPPLHSSYSAISNSAPSSSSSSSTNIPPPREKGSGGAQSAGSSSATSISWQARRKQSFAAVFGQGGPGFSGGGESQSQIEAHVQNTARETKKDVASVISNLSISEPYNVEHKLRVKFDEENIRYSGLPDDWSKEAHKQFGIPLHACPRVDVPGYKDRIPLVLVKLKQRFEELDGFRTEGIFRLAPDGEDCADVKSSLNAGQALKSLQTAKDPHVVANLIKQFFRELKPKVLCSWSKEQVMELASVQADDLTRAGELIASLPEPQKSTFLWLMDLLADVAAQAGVNKMNWSNLAIVLSPNLYDAGPDVAPMEELILSQKVAQCTSNCLKWRIQERMGGGDNR